MSEMVDRVAKAIEVTWMSSDCEWHELARAAIAAMREPTPEMINVAAHQLHDENVWKAMIDEALK